ncbi:hypothetical protein AMJ39_06530 [candidate division TA06 bacterium DG_24]|uniref:Uncharacterized protein n=3 Tax=Bacteria division TA06 TaxID=1156500 RepID=A0A0S8G537_UNCT6|nr:MAG: hypothetical protein AMJ39_06530 [candidate division TA06 bacterium DG_24]KPK68079.1 MAG: hypothetical protein AMJ82_09150 [candidate division TA06 bacterium SM23_40]
MRRDWSSVAVLLALVAALCLAGCASEEPTGGDGDGLTAEELVAQANGLVEQDDYAGANALYKQAISLDPQNLDAQFGAGVTEALVMYEDPELAEAIQAWIEFFEFEPVPPPSPGLLGDATLSPSTLVFFGGVLRMTSGAIQQPPPMSEMQELLRDNVLPVFAYVMARFQVLEANPSFQFILTPGMTGEPENIEVDLGDIYLAHAGLEAARAAIYFLISYDFDVDDYENPSWETLLGTGSSFLTLYPEGWSYLTAARDDLLSAVVHAEDGLDAILAETDDQSDDLTTVSDPNDPNLELARELLDDLEATLNSPIDVEIPWEQPGEPTVSVYLGQLFLNPIQDWKEKLPDYHFEEGMPILDEPITFSDPTFNGILPGMTNERLREIFGL